MDIANIFKAILQNRQVSFHELSQQSGIPVRTIEEWYYNDREPSLYKAEKVLIALGYTITIEKRESIKEGGDVR